jgi:SP family facilitated glucose transporter-like MFS transporter 8
MYVGEIASIEMRGSLLNVIHVLVNCGLLFIYTMGQNVDLNTINAAMALIPLIYAIGFYFLIPESIPFLISKQKIEKAQNSMLLKDYKTEVIKIDENKTKSDEKSFAELMKEKATRKALIIMSLQFLFFQLSGFSAVSFYSKIILMESGIENPGMASIVNIIFMTIFSIVNIFVVKRFRRKVMLCTFNAFNVVGLFGVGIYFVLKDHDFPLENLKWLPLTSFCINSFSFCFGMGSISYCLLGELFKVEAKKVIAPLTQIMNHGLTFLIAISFPYLTSSEMLGTGYTFLIFAFSTFCNILFAIKFIPETKDKSLDEIQKLLSQ